jgi:hypothetical protein
MNKQRRLTAGEIALARASFGDKIDYRKVAVADGPGSSFAAQIAFARGNPAITLGSTIHFRTGYCADFSAAGADRKSFIHEMTHVWQYAALGVAPFIARYAREVAKAGLKPNDMYKYVLGRSRFGSAMLEAQATMVEDYGEAIWSGNAARMALIGTNLAGSGLYGL